MQPIVEPRLLSCGIACLTLVIGSTTVSAGDWPHWRGPHRDGRVDEPSGWSPGRAWCSGEPRWRTNVGQGGTSPLVIGDRVYVMGWRKGRDSLYCLDRRTGKTIWQQQYPSPPYGRHSKGDQYFYGGPSSTPEYDPASGLLWTLSVDGELRCWDTHRDGRMVWRINLYDTYRVPQRRKLTRHGHRDYGYTTSPLVHGKWVVVEVGAPDHGNLIAFDKQTGKELWRSESRDPAGHSGGPLPISVRGKPCLAIVTQKHLLVASLAPDSPGKTVGQAPWVTDYANSIAAPGTDGTHLYLTSNYNLNRLVKFAVERPVLREVWRTRHPSKVCCPVVDETSVYFAWRDIWCFDRETGKVRWRAGLSLGDPGSMILTRDARLVAWTGKGRLILLENARRSPDRYRELARTREWFEEDAWPHVVLAQGDFYLKDRMGNLICLPAVP